MTKFTNIKLDDEMYSVVFGLGKVIFVLAKSLRLDGYYVFEVEYENGQKVHYTEDGKPGWCKDITKCMQTTYYKYEINFDELDTKSKNSRLKKHQINDLLDNDLLEMQSPAGGWIDANLMPDIMLENAINNGEYHLFRKMIL
ncbi:MAG: hypothetical protein U9Q40_00435 [Campylobacterota bacterium]|nr:hypothetical protein [Campylobacterota bacterium]